MYDIVGFVNTFFGALLAKERTQKRPRGGAGVKGACSLAFILTLDAGPGHNQNRGRE